MNYLRFTIYCLKRLRVKPAMTTNVRCKFYVFVLCSLFFVLNANAQSDSIPFSLDEVQITGKKVANEIIPPRKLSGATLQNLSAQSVADAVRFFSGVQVKDYGGIGGLKTINIRSMGTNQMGVFYDGIQLGNAQNGQIDLGRFSLDNIESISIYNGQKSSALQSAKDYGAAGTIHIQTLRPKFDENEHFHIITRLKSGSFGLINPSILWQQKLHKNVYMTASAEFLHANGKYKFRFQSFNTTADTIAVRKNGDITAFRGEIGFFGNIKDGEWKVQFYNYNSERGLTGHIAAGVFEHHERQKDNNFFTQLSVKQHFNKYSFLINAKYANDYTQYKNSDSNTKIIVVNYNQNEIYFSFANSYKPFKIWEIALSADYQYNNLFSNRDDFSFPSRNMLLVAAASNVKLKFVKIQASLLGTFVKDEVKIGVAHKQKPQFTPAIMASFSPFHRFPLDFRAFYKRIFRMPTFNDLYYTISTNSYLKPEFVQQYDFGLEYILFKNKEQRTKNKDRFVKNLNISVDFYYNYVENKIAAVPTSNPFRWQMMNLGKVKIFGVDFSSDIEFLLYKDLTLNILANYSFEDARDFSDPQVAGKPNSFYGHLIPYAPQNCATIAANFQYKNLRFNYSFLYTGERFSSSENYAQNYLPAFQTHDVSVGYTFLIDTRHKTQDTSQKRKYSFSCGEGWGGVKETQDARQHKLSVNLDINNIFNQQYDVVLNYPMPGTNFKVAVKWEF